MLISFLGVVLFMFGRVFKKIGIKKIITITVDTYFTIFYFLSLEYSNTFHVGTTKECVAYIVFGDGIFR